MRARYPTLHSRAGVTAPSVSPRRFIDGTLNARGDRDKGWSLEVAIPWANFEELSHRPEAGAVWTAAFNRWDGVEPDRRLSMWVDPLDSSPNPHHPERFGDLVFVK